MFRHLQRRHTTIYNNYVKEKAKAQLTKAVPETDSQPSLAVYLTSHADTDDRSGSRNVYARGHPQQVMLADSIMKNLIIGCNLPVSLVDNPQFRQCFRDFDGKFSMPCRQTVINQSINQVYYFSSTLQARFHTQKKQ